MGCVIKNTPDEVCSRTWFQHSFYCVYFCVVNIVNKLQRILSDSEDDGDNCDLRTKLESARSSPVINISTIVVDDEVDDEEDSNYVREMETSDRRKVICLFDDSIDVSG